MDFRKYEAVRYEVSCKLEPLWLLQLEVSL